MDTTILLIDDDVRILQTFARTLKLAGYTVFAAEDGAAGLSIYHQEQPDIVLLDLRMPGMDGLKVLQAIRTHDPEANVILATGHGDKDAVIEALRAGASDFLSKPIDQVSLESALRRAEERIHLKRELRASQEALRQHNLHLEEQVKARTAELEREIEERKQTEVTLRESEEGYRTLVEGIEEAIATANEKGVLLFVNGVAARRLGGRPEDFVGRSMHDLFPPDAADRQATYIRHVIETQQSMTTETITVLQGVRRWYRTNIQPLRNYEGTVDAALLIARDITEEKRAEKALRESEEKYRLLAETTRDIIVLHDMEARISYVNQAGLHFAGFSASETIGQPITTFIPTDHLADIETRRMQRASGDDQGHLYETEFVNRNGCRIPVEVNSTPVSREGHVSEILLVARDITERKQAEEGLRFQAHLLDAVEQAIIVTDLGGRVVYWNPFAEQLYGWPADEAMGKTTPELIGSEQSRQRTAEIMACLQKGASWSGEYLARRRDGTSFPISVTCTPISDERGELTHIIGVSADITERKHIEEALQESLAKYRVLFDAFPLGITVADTDGNILEANRLSDQLLGISQEEHTQRKIDGEEWHIIRPDGSPMPAGEYASVRTLKERRLVSNVEMGIVKPDGEITWINVTAAPLMDDRVVVTYNDVTERKQAEERLQKYAEQLEVMVEEKVRELEAERAKAIQMDKLAALGEMATGIAHELQQPLTAIQLEADYLKMVGAKARTEHEDDLNAMVNGAALEEIGTNLQRDLHRCRRLINHLSDFGRISKEAPIPINLNDPIRDSLIIVGTQLRNHDVDVRLDLADGLPLIMAHTHRLEQVFLNLISNAEHALACQAAQQSSYQKVLEIATHTIGDEVIATVHDNGCGIPENVRERIFDPFFTTKPRGDGTGLGLSISYGIVTNYGGEIACESVEDNGTTFTLRFPIADRDRGS